MPTRSCRSCSIQQLAPFVLAANPHHQTSKLPLVKGALIDLAPGLPTSRPSVSSCWLSYRRSASRKERRMFIEWSLSANVLSAEGLKRCSAWQRSLAARHLAWYLLSARARLSSLAQARAEKCRPMTRSVAPSLSAQSSSKLILQARQASAAQSSIETNFK